MSDEYIGYSKYTIEYINQNINPLNDRVTVLENAGVVGPQGIQGEKGDTGDVGPIGPIGDTGPQGIQGEKGDTGDVGPIGPIGDTGPQGIQGEKGDTGDVGPIGPIGDTGPQGIQGEKGDTGDVGPIGDTGPQGIQGEKGDTGDVGPQGIQGEKGDTGSPNPNATGVIVQNWNLDGLLYLTMTSGQTGIQTEYTNSNLIYINDTQTLVCPNFSGKASSASTATITNTTTSSLIYYPVFVENTSGDQTLRTDSSTFSWRPSTNLLTISGSLKSGSITDSNNSTGSSSQILSASTNGNSLTWINPLSVSGTFTNIITMGGSIGNVNTVTYNVSASPALLNTISRFLSTNYTHTQGSLSGTNLDTSNNRFNVTVSGKYKIEVCLNIRTQTAGYDVWIFVRVNGSNLNSNNTYYGAAGMTGGNPWFVNGTLNLNLSLNNGDYIDFVSQSVAGAFNALLYSGSSISITRIE